MSLIATHTRPHGDRERIAAGLALAHRAAVLDGPDIQTYAITAAGREKLYHYERLEGAFTSSLYRYVITSPTPCNAGVDAMVDDAIAYGLFEDDQADDDHWEQWVAEIRGHLHQLKMEGMAHHGDPLDVFDDLYHRRSQPIADVLPRPDRPAPSWLIQGIMVAGGDDYGVLAAEAKAGKTWLALDLTVAVAAGRPWLGRYPTGQTTVLVYSSEGGAHTIGRRVQAVADHYGVDPSTLPIHLITDAPDLTTDTGVQRFANDIRITRPGLIIVDPLYRASRNVNSASLNEVGGVLGAAQEAAQKVGAALLVVAHWNQTGIGTGAKRISGAGPWEWARVVISMHVAGGTAAATDDNGTTTTVTNLAVEIGGGNRPAQALALTRTIASDLMDLAAPITYAIEAGEAVAPADLAAEIVRAITETPGLTRADLYRPGPTRVGPKDAVGAAVRELLERAEIEERPHRQPGARRKVNSLFPASNEETAASCAVA